MRNVMKAKVTSFAVMGLAGALCFAAPKASGSAKHNAAVSTTAAPAAPAVDWNAVDGAAGRKGDVLAGDVLVETATDGIVEVTQGRQVVLEVAARVHTPSLTTIMFDKQGVEAMITPR